MSFAGMSYKLGDIDKVEFKQVSALEIYRDAGKKIHSVQPPPSFAPLHQEYAGALQAYQDASIEMARQSNPAGAMRI
jgi:hypothetical protein